MLELRNVQYMVGEKTVLQNVSTVFPSGQVTGIVGPNGAGKSSLMRVAAGLVGLTGGTVTAQIKKQATEQTNGSHDDFSEPQWRAKNIAYMPQFQTTAWPLSAREVVMLGLLPFGLSLMANSAEAEAKTDAALARCGAEKFAERTIDTLSGGEQARVYLARLLVGGASCLLLDEPTQSLDAAGALAVMQLLTNEAEAGAAIGVVVHDLNLARRFCDHVVVLQNGHVAADGAPRDVLSPSVLRPIFGVEFKAAGKNGFLIPDRPI